MSGFPSKPGLSSKALVHICYWPLLGSAAVTQVPSSVPQTPGTLAFEKFLKTKAEKNFDIQHPDFAKQSHLIKRFLNGFCCPCSWQLLVFQTQQCNACCAHGVKR